MKNEKEFKTKEEYKKTRARAAKALMGLVAKKIEGKGFGPVYCKETTQGRTTVLEFRAGGYKWGFCYAVRWYGSYDKTDIMLDKSVVRKLKKLSKQYDCFRFVSMFTDGNSVVTDINSKCSEYEWTCPIVTSTNEQHKYSEKTVCGFSKIFDSDLNFDREWVYDGKRPVINKYVEVKKLF